MFVLNIVTRRALGLGLLALPGLAHAGTSTATGTASFNVVNQCSVTGTTVNLGTYTTSQTWGGVANTLGAYDYGGYTAGTSGQEYINWGSVTCDAGTPYTLEIKGGSAHPYSPGGIVFLRNELVPGSGDWDFGVHFNPFVKKIGATVIPDNDLPGLGGYVGSIPAAAVGTGAPQAVLGSVTMNWTTSWATWTSGLSPTDQLKADSFSDTLTYTLNF